MNSPVKPDQAVEMIEPARESKGIVLLRRNLSGFATIPLDSPETRKETIELVRRWLVEEVL